MASNDIDVGIEGSLYKLKKAHYEGVVSLVWMMRVRLFLTSVIDEQMRLLKCDVSVWWTEMMLVCDEQKMDQKWCCCKEPDLLTERLDNPHASQIKITRVTM